MLKLKPSAKLKRRYLLVSGDKKNIEKAILDYLGILGWANAAPYFVRQKNSNWIIAVNRQELDKVKAAFAVSADKLEVLRVSGTLHGLDKK